MKKKTEEEEKEEEIKKCERSTDSACFSVRNFNGYSLRGISVLLCTCDQQLLPTALFGLIASTYGKYVWIVSMHFGPIRNSYKPNGQYIVRCNEWPETWENGSECVFRLWMKINSDFKEMVMLFFSLSVKFFYSQLHKSFYFCVLRTVNG